MPATYRTTRLVEFHDTDAAGIAHFSAFFRYMEEVEHEFLRAHGLSVLMRDDEGVLSWPRVAASCQFRGAVKFEDVVEIELRVARVGDKSISYAFAFSHQGREVADGEITAVCCRMIAGSAPHAVPIPPSILSKLPLDTTAEG